MDFLFDIVWERIRSTTGWQKYTEFADFLGIKPSSVAGAKSRGKMPIEWALKVADHYEVSIDWLLVGKWKGLNAKLLEVIIERVEMMLADNPQVKCPPEKKARLIAAHYKQYRHPAGRGGIYHNEIDIEYIDENLKMVLGNSLYFDKKL